MKPLKNYVLVADAGEDTKTTAGGIILQTDIDTGSKPGFVVAVGPDVQNVKATTVSGHICPEKCRYFQG